MLFRPEHPITVSYKHIKVHRQLPVNLYAKSPTEKNRTEKPV